VGVGCYGSLGYQFGNLMRDPCHYLEKVYVIPYLMK
jgi:hypothetical protein